MAMNEFVNVFSEFLEKKGLKMTSQRSMILDTFMTKEGHFTSEELYDIVKKKDGAIGQATVYRTLKLLSESGIAQEVDFSDGVVRYEHKYGHEHHDHLICNSCGKNIEVLDRQIEDLQEKIARKHGFTLTGHKMYLNGICRDCRKKM